MTVAQIADGAECSRRHAHAVLGALAKSEDVRVAERRPLMFAALEDTMNKQETIESLHKAFTELQGSICSVDKVEQMTTLPSAYKSILRSIITDMEAVAERIEKVENIARASLAK